MKQLTEYRRVTAYLDKIFNLLNDRYFENALSKPVITIQSTPDAYGHVSCARIWNANGEARHELNIGAGTLSRPIEETVATMVHEMVHLYCIKQGIKDTSRGCTYHNRHFRDEAEKRDLHVEHSERYGWTITSPTDGLIQFCLDHDLTEIEINRNDGCPLYSPPPVVSGDDDEIPVSYTAPTPPRTSSTRKYKCPKCGMSVRATRVVSLICGSCFRNDGESIAYLEEV